MIFNVDDKTYLKLFNTNHYFMFEFKALTFYVISL